MEDVSEQVEQGVEEYVEPEVMEQPMEPELEAPMEPAMEQELETPMEPPTPAPRIRVRKVRVKAPTDTREAQPEAPDPNYWNSRLQEHRSSQRLAKDERYGNLRIM